MKEKGLATALFIVLLMQFSSAMTIANSQIPDPSSEVYLNMRFWDVETDRCFRFQETTNSCVSASVQMILTYLDYSPLPNQSQVTSEMHTDINHTTEWRYIYLPFKDRGFSEYLNQSLSRDFNQALSYLKGNLSRNFPVIINTWYDENAKSKGDITHARVVTGYNSTGVFFHDPWSGPNQFLNNSEFSNLWRTDSGFWAFIITREPKFSITVEIRDLFGNPIQGVQLFLEEADYTQVTDSNGIAEFSSLPIDNYTLSYSWRLQSGKHTVALTHPKKIGFRLYLSNLTIFLTTVILVTAVLIVVGTAHYRQKLRRNLQ
jgi:predicted double-glycine peptidase